MIVLTACQPLQPVDSSKKHQAKHETKDSAPQGPIPRFFKAIIPKEEPLSRYGNPASYRVRGQRYAVMNSAHGFKQRGLASWYGTKFHSRRTSSGEHYDMYALTAAHKTLPLPTYVRVKNLDNGRNIIVKVNDRGPFHPGRIIDLSYGAAVKLGIYPRGTARVELEAITTNAAQRSAIAAHHQYYLQVGAFRTKRSAVQLQRTIRRFSKMSVLIKYERNQYLVRLGPFMNRQTMQRAQVLMKRHGINRSFSLIS